MTDALINMAQVDQQEHPIDDGEEIETVEVDGMPDDPEAGAAGDTASNDNSRDSEEIN